MAAWQPHFLLDAELKEMDDLLMVTPNDVELRFNRAATLAELGRNLEARNAYIELLALEPAHFGALNNLGTLLLETGYHTAARTVYAEAIKYHPDNPTAHVNLANAFAKHQDTESARKHFEIALRIDPEHPEAHQGLAHLLTDIGDEENARIHRIKGFKDRSIMILPYRGKDTPIALLLLASASGGTVPIQHHLDPMIFFTSVLFVDFYDPSLPFPPHHLVFNVVGDADLCQQSLAMAANIITTCSKAPVINPPGAVIKTGRAANAKRFSNIPGVITPKMIVLPRESITSASLVHHGFALPLLLRSPGFHTGRFFKRVEDEKALEADLIEMPGNELMVIEYLDTKSRDGKIRKYRVMMIDGVIYPLHVAISREWKIHYFSAEMAENPENRAEDAAFLENMPKVLGLRAMAALEQICKELGLDYAGADFSLSPDGDIILFETNATMVVNLPDADARWDYRRPAVQRILDAIRNMLIKHAGFNPANYSNSGDGPSQ